MMIVKSRSMSRELLVLEFLNKRMPLSHENKQYYLNQKKGYEGELLFDTHTEKLKCECMIINDLLLKVNNVTFQIDSLILTLKNIYLYEIKNFEGDYYFESDRFFKRPKSEIANPLHQLSRSKFLLRQLLFEIGFQLPIDSSVVFINPYFALYQAPLDQRLLFFPTQIDRPPARTFLPCLDCNLAVRATCMDISILIGVQFVRALSPFSIFGNF